MKPLVAALLLSATLLAGCKDTIFEAQPGGKISTCDEHFVGKWRLVSADTKRDNDELFVIVEPGCRKWRYVEDGKDDAETENTTHIAFAKVAEMPLLTLKIDEKTKPNDAQARWHNGYLYLRYEFVDKTIRLHHVDNSRVAHLIIDDKVRGRTERVQSEPFGPRGSFGGSDELHNFVAGNGDEMTRVAQLDGIFADDDYYLLKPATDAEIFKAAKKPAKP